MFFLENNHSSVNSDAKIKTIFVQLESLHTILCKKNYYFLSGIDRERCKLLCLIVAKNTLHRSQLILDGY